MDCERCMDTGTVETPMGNERGCPACPRGDAFERMLARESFMARERDMDATGQDLETFEEDA